MTTRRGHVTQSWCGARLRALEQEGEAKGFRAEEKHFRSYRFNRKLVSLEGMGSVDQSF